MIPSADLYISNNHIDIIISSRGVYQAKIAKGSNWASVGKIEEFGTTEPSLEDVIRRFKTQYNVNKVSEFDIFLKNKVLI